MLEHYFQCPYCWEQISMLMDLSVPAQEYLEDCEVCCHPIMISFQVENNEISYFDAFQALD
jgi:transcription elongation factor Elf1